jgi:hypothetical protein
MWLWIYIILISFAANVLWVFYIKYTAEDKMWKAAMYGELIVLCECLVVFDFVQDLWLTVPVILGGFTGTLVSNKIVNWLTKKKKK